MSGKRRRRDPQQSKTALMAAAAALFGAYGYEATSLDQIAVAAGVNKAMVSYYFGDKDGLFLAILSEAVAHVRRRLESDLPETAPAPQRLRTYIRILVQAFIERPDFAPMVLRRNLAGSMDAQHYALAKELAGFLICTESILRQGAQEGTLRPTDAHVAHLTLIGSILFFLSTRRLRQAMPVDQLGPVQAELDPSVEHFIEYLQGLTLRGLQA